MRRISIIALAVLISGNSFGQWFKPVVSLVPFYLQSTNYTTIEAGKFSVSSRKINIGVEASNDFPITEDYVVGVGLRYFPYTTFIYGLNQIAALHDNPAPFKWTRRFGSLSVPIKISKRFSIDEKREGRIFAGVSLGIFFANSQKDEGQSSVLKNIYNTDTFGYEDWNSGQFEPTQFISSIELGGEIQPFKTIKQIKIGLFANYQLNKVTIGDFHAKASNLSQKIDYPYEAQVKQQFMAFGLLLSYQFERKRQMENKK